jgi:hypothetical protein
VGSCEPANGLRSVNGVERVNGLSSTSGVEQVNGLSFVDGCVLMNGLRYVGGCASKEACFSASLLILPCASMLNSAARLNLSDFRILGSTSGCSDLRILESLHIFKRIPCLTNAFSLYSLEIVIH